MALGMLLQPQQVVGGEAETCGEHVGEEERAERQKHRAQSQQDRGRRTGAGHKSLDEAVDQQQEHGERD